MIIARWGVAGERRHAFTHECAGCCDTQADHEGTYFPRAVCGNAWASSVAPADDESAPTCQSCKGIIQLAQSKGRVAL